MATFEVITTNKEKTVGIVTNTSGLKNVGDFKITNLEAFVRKIREVFGEGNEGHIQIDFKLSENPETPGHVILASVDGHEPHIAVCGEYLSDGNPWDKAKPGKKG